MIKLYVVCSGLGRTNRGYEAFFASLHNAFSASTQLSLTTFKGGGPAGSNERRLLNLSRESLLAKRIGSWASVGSPHIGRGYYVEQLTFFLSLVPRLIVGRPDVVYFSDYDLGRFLWRWRQLSGQKFRLLFCNGGAYPPPYERFDHVQQLTPDMLQRAIEGGVDADDQSLLPLAFDIEAQIEPLAGGEKVGLRRSLDLPVDRPVVLCVSAVDITQKRLDYVIRELSVLPQPRPFLAVLGQRGAESPEVERLAAEMLGPDGYVISTVPAEKVSSYYRAADVLVLASLREGFGRVMVEAQAQGLLCIAHDDEVMRFVLGDMGCRVDLSQPGTLAATLDEKLLGSANTESKAARGEYAYGRFSWDMLQMSYLQLFERCAAGTQDFQPNLDFSCEEISVKLSDGTTLGGLRFGNGEAAPVCLCIHGLGVDAFVWRFVAEALCRQGIDMVCLELRAHGHSQPGAWRKLNARHLARDLVEACDRLDLSPQFLLAQSFGALVLREMFAQFQDQFVDTQCAVVTPVWSAHRASWRSLPGTALEALRFLKALGKATGYSRRPQGVRKDHARFADWPDSHWPRFVEEATAISWLRYARLLVELRLKRYQRFDWSAYRSRKVRVFTAQHDELWDNREVEALCGQTGWPLEALDMRHVSVSTDPAHARTFARLLGWSAK